MLLTDHRNLEYLFNQQTMLNARMTRWVITLQEFDFVCRYIPGSQNVLTDHLSRDTACLAKVALVKYAQAHPREMERDLTAVNPDDVDAAEL